MSREIVFSARDNGVSSFMDKMRRSAVDVGRGLLEDAQAQSKSAKEAIANYEKQIALIDKKSKLEMKAARIEAESTRDEDLSTAKNITREREVKQTYTEKIKNISQDGRTDQLQIELLKEIAAAIKGSAAEDRKQEAKNSREETDQMERLVQGEDGGDDTWMKGDDGAFINVADALRNEGSVSDPVEPESKGQVNQHVKSGLGIAQAQDGEGAITKTLNTVGKGMILGTLAGGMLAVMSVLKIRAHKEQSAETVAALSGRTNKSVVDSEEGMHGINQYGVSRADFLSKYMPSAIRSAGTSVGAEERAKSHLRMEKGLALTSGTGESLTKLQRVLDNTSNPTRVEKAIVDNSKVDNVDNKLEEVDDKLQEVDQLNDRVEVKPERIEVDSRIERVEADKPVTVETDPTKAEVPVPDKIEREDTTRLKDRENDPTNLLNTIYSSMADTGAFGKDNNDMARLQDIVSGFVGFQEGELSRAGVTDGDVTMQVMRGLQGVGQRFSRDDYAMQTVSQLNSGLTSSGSAEARAIKFDVLRKANPEMSFFDLQTQMDQGINSPKYLEGILDFVKGSGGNLNSQSLLMDSLTGGAMRKKDITSILKGDMKIEEFDQKELGVEGRAQAATSEVNATLTILNETFKDGMTKLGGGIWAMKDFLSTMDTSLEEINKNTQTLRE
jgi:hypothetical protein